MVEWKKYRIKDLGIVVTGKTPSSRFPEDFGNHMPFVTPTDYKYYGKWADSSDRGLSKNGIKKLQRKVLPPKSILVTCIGSDMGKVVLNKLPVITNQQINSIIPNQELVTPDFLYYKIVDSYETLRIYSQAGSAVPIVNKCDFEEISLELPEDIEEQKSIASILGSLDDKIDLLHRQNKTLEALAETLFRQWFVEEAEEGWEKGVLSDLCITITKGTTPTTLGHQFTESGINFIKAESITDSGDFIIEKLSKISEDTHNFLNRSIIQDHDVLCSIAGTIGRIAIVIKDILPANTNQAIAILRVNNEKCFPEFVCLFLKSSQFKEIMDGKIVHAVQPNLSLGEIGNTEIRIPPKELLKEFKQLVMPLFGKKYSNGKQIRTLTRLRDNLLPKLMSGELRVKLPLTPSLTKEGEREILG